MGGGAFSKRTLRALGAFGLTTHDVRSHHDDLVRQANGLAARLDALLTGGRIALVRGPSGGGKSTVLRALATRVGATGGLVLEARPPGGRASRRTVIDLLARTPSRIPAALAALGAAGLGDAMIVARRAQELSEGQRARLAIARAIMRTSESANGLATVIIDELAGALDDATAESLCIGLSRWARATPAVRMVAASARNDISQWLDADLELAVGEPCESAITHRAAVRRSGVAGTEITIAEGTLADYLHLAHLHYRAKRPATCVRVLVARSETERHPIGVLTVSMPTLNGAWRALAWPGEYDGAVVPRDQARRINRDIRTISRVIVDPRYRARGVATALIRRYLASPLTIRTEAIAAMGNDCPLFLRAGMRAWTPPESRRDNRLRDALDAADLHPWMLADVNEAAAAIANNRTLERAFRTWASDHGATRALTGAPIHDLVRAAARKIIVRPRAHTAG
jgi:ABC-type nitrate/sulfonate/bicarbonate transport system ATPase subunit/GNAT superfamily N-acetyltransferase